MNLFLCYSVPLMEFITKNHKIEYKLVALNPNNMKKFWVFIKNKDLEQILIKWKETKPIEC